MHKKSSKRNKLYRLIVLYFLMTVAVIVMVTMIVFFVLGYRLDTDSGHVEQYAFLQFNSIPTGATVTVDGATVSSKTPNKSSVPPGKHTVTMQRDGYQTWTKTVEVKAGTLTWLNYALLVPSKMTVEPVANYESLDMTLASPKGRYMLVHKYAEGGSFELVDISSDTIKSTTLTIPANYYSGSYVTGAAHKFTIEKWDDGERYVLIKHSYANKDEWLVMDTQNAALTKNISKMFDVPIASIGFSGTSGNILYILSSGEIRKLDLSAGTISKSLVSNVTSFAIYDESNVITYTGLGKAGTAERVVGLYREGDSKSVILKTVTSASDVPLNVATARYFNEDYVVISEGKKIDVLGGSYPETASEVTASLKTIASLTSKLSVYGLTFSPTGEYILFQSGANFASYDLEYQTYNSSVIECSSQVPALTWINNNYIWSDCGGSLSIREFDGSNIHAINSALAGQDATITKNRRYLYSIDKTAAGYQLQRVRLTLP